MFQTSGPGQNRPDASRPTDEEPDAPVSHPFAFAGETFLALRSGALFHPQRSLLLVADLHLEKGSAFARTGQFLPPYDSHMTLAQLEADIAVHQPQTVICLGDSFHDTDGPNRLDGAVKTRLCALTKRLSWHWITGNHDPHLPQSLGGDVVKSQTLEGADGGIFLCHEPGEGNREVELERQTPHRAEICGHLHPVVSIPSRGRTLRRKCFLISPERIVMPAYGAYTGGINVHEPVLTALATRSSRLLVIGRQVITEHPFDRIRRAKR